MIFHCHSCPYAKLICLLLQLKRAHSADPDSASSPRKSPSAGIATPPETVAPGGLAPLGGAAGIFGKSLTDDSNVVGSPLKKARASLGGADAIGGGDSTGGSFPPALGDILAKAQAAQASQDQERAAPPMKMEEEEL